MSEEKSRYEIRTQRLRLVALDAQDMELWLNDITALEVKLGCKYLAEPTEALRPVLRYQIDHAAAEGDKAFWRDFWWIIRLDDGVAVGSFDFKNPPDSSGSVEIGYGLAPAFEGNGYMTETVSAAIEFVKGREEVKRVIAETEKDNFKSMAVLTRCGFTKTGEDKTIMWEKII